MYKYDYFQFSSVFIKKNNQIDFFLKNRNWFKLIGFGSVRFFRIITVQTDLAWFFMVFFDLGSVRFGFFSFRLIKPKSNRTGRFFQNFYQFFFHGLIFSIIIFYFLNILVFFLTPNYILESSFEVCFLLLLLPIRNSTNLALNLGLKGILVIRHCD